MKEEKFKENYRCSRSSLKDMVEPTFMLTSKVLLVEEPPMTDSVALLKMVASRNFLNLSI